MASRKAKPRGKRSSPLDVHDAVVHEAPPDAHPSSSLTVEVHSLAYGQMPHAAPTVRALEDLAATVEIPSLGALGPRLLVMDAAEAVIADRGFGKSTVKETAEWAGVSVDVFHAHFTDERALLAALAERLCGHAIAAIDDATRPGVWDGKPMAAPIDFAIRGFVDLMLSRAALLRAIRASGDRELVDELRRVGTHLTIRLTRTLEGRPEKPDPLDIGFAVLIAVSIAHHAAVIGTEWSGVELDREEISRRAADAAVAYIERSLRSR